MDDGPFFHGTAATFAVGDEIAPGFRSHFRPGEPLRHVYLTSLVPTAAYGAQLAAALRPPVDGDDGDDGDPATRRGRIYVVEPTGPVEDDPNVTDRTFPGNPTRSYRSLAPLRVLGELEGWEAHPPERIQQLLDGLERLRAEGRDVIED